MPALPDRNLLVLKQCFQLLRAAPARSAGPAPRSRRGAPAAAQGRAPERPARPRPPTGDSRELASKHPPPTQWAPPPPPPPPAPTRGGGPGSTRHHPPPQTLHPT